MKTSTTDRRHSMHVHIYLDDQGTVHVQLLGRLRGVSGDELGQLVGALSGAALRIEQCMATAAARRNCLDAFSSAFGVMRQEFAQQSIDPLAEAEEQAEAM